MQAPGRATGDTTSGAWRTDYTDIDFEDVPVHDSSEEMEVTPTSGQQQITYPIQQVIDSVLPVFKTLHALDINNLLLEDWADFVLDLKKVAQGGSVRGDQVAEICSGIFGCRVKSLEQLGEATSPLIQEVVEKVQGEITALEVQGLVACDIYNRDFPLKNAPGFCQQLSQEQVWTTLYRYLQQFPTCPPQWKDPLTIFFHKLLALQPNALYTSREVQAVVSHFARAGLIDSNRLRMSVELDVAKVAGTFESVKQLYTLFSAVRRVLNPEQARAIFVSCLPRDAVDKVKEHYMHPDTFLETISFCEQFLQGIDPTFTPKIEHYLVFKDGQQKELTRGDAALLVTYCRRFPPHVVCVGADKERLPSLTAKDYTLLMNALRDPFSPTPKLTFAEWCALAMGAHALLFDPTVLFSFLRTEMVPATPEGITAFLKFQESAIFDDLAYRACWVEKRDAILSALLSQEFRSDCFLPEEIVTAKSALLVPILLAMQSYPQTEEVRWKHLKRLTVPELVYPLQDLKQFKFLEELEVIPNITAANRELFEDFSCFPHLRKLVNWNVATWFKPSTTVQTLVITKTDRFWFLRPEQYEYNVFSKYPNLKELVIHTPSSEPQLAMNQLVALIRELPYVKERNISIRLE